MVSLNNQIQRKRQIIPRITAFQSKKDRLSAVPIKIIALCNSLCSFLVHFQVIVFLLNFLRLGLVLE